jgi:hypothetical protein
MEIGKLYVITVNEKPELTQKIKAMINRTQEIKKNLRSIVNLNPNLYN